MAVWTEQEISVSDVKIGDFVKYEGATFVKILGRSEDFKRRTVRLSFDCDPFIETIDAGLNVVVKKDILPDPDLHCMEERW